MPVDHVNAVELYWERRGSGPRLLFCNGSGTTLQTVRPLLDVVAANFDLLAWDYRGLGRSVPLTGAYTMADLAADAVGLLEIAGWDTCRVLGVSFGGMVAQEFTVTNPERVERLALACTSAGGDGGSSYPLSRRFKTAPRSHRASEEPSCAATTEGTCSCPRTRLHCRNSRHSSKRRRSVEALRDPLYPDAATTTWRARVAGRVRGLLLSLSLS
jgi:3-oxoadipate enol-lactonase